jgi:hypothetical protein
MHEDQLDLPMQEHDHQPLAFFSGEFKGAQQRWNEQENDGFAIAEDDLSGYLWIVQCSTADAEATVDAPLRWFTVFCVVLLSYELDRGSQFKNKVVRRMQKYHKAKHHFTTVNCPWSNGTRFRMQVGHTFFPCSSIRVEDAHNRVARGGQLGADRPE